MVGVGGRSPVGVMIPPVGAISPPLELTKPRDEEISPPEGRIRPPVGTIVPTGPLGTDGTVNSVVPGTVRFLPALFPRFPLPPGTAGTPLATGGNPEVPG